MRHVSYHFLPADGRQQAAAEQPSYRWTRGRHQASICIWRLSAPRTETTTISAQCLIAFLTLHSVLSKCKAPRPVYSKNIMLLKTFSFASILSLSMKACLVVKVWCLGWVVGGCLTKMSISRHDTLHSPQLPAAAPIIASASARARPRAVQANIFWLGNKIYKTSAAANFELKFYSNYDLNI